MGNQCKFCKQIETIKEEPKTTIYETEEFKNIPYTLLNGNIFIEGKKICKFINYQCRRIYYKIQYKQQLYKLKQFFIPEKNNVSKNKQYYINILNQKIKEFFENKKRLLDNIFDKDEYFLDFNDFDNLKKMIKQYYANDIYNNKINFYNEFIEYIKKKKTLKTILEEKTLNENDNENEKKKEKNKINNNSSKKNIMEIKEKKDMKIQNLTDHQINIIQNDIENIFNICLSTPNDKLPKKINEIDNTNQSFFLMLFLDESKLNTKTYISGKLRIFIKLFYYIYIMKKYNFISSTEGIYYKKIKDNYNEVLYNENNYINNEDEKIISIPQDKKKIILNHFFEQKKSISKINYRDENMDSKESIHFSNNQLNINNSFNYDIKSYRTNNNSNNESILNKSYNTKNKNNSNNNIVSNKKKRTTTKIFNEKKKKLIFSEQVLPKINIQNEQKENENDDNKSFNKNLNKTLTQSQTQKTISKRSFKNNFLRKNTKYIPYNHKININKNEKQSITRLFKKKTKNFELNSLDLINNIINDNKKIEIYEGEYDNSLYLYAGLGTLIKPKHSSLYNGTFRYGKKEGIGIYYREYSKDHFKYYMGEFTKNKFDGFGLLIEFNYKYVIIQKGIFSNSYFISGILYIFNEKIENRFEIIKFEGELQPNISNIIIYKNFGHLFKLNYIFNKKKQIYEFEEEYDYTGFFEFGKEEGKGFLRHKFKKVGYSYEYKGDFINGEKNGFGIIEYNDDFFIKKYEGFFKNNNTCYKYGIVYFNSGDIYEGFFDENNFKSICGLYWHNNKNENYLYYLGVDNYFGEFKNDKKNGIGRYISYQDNLNQVLFGNYLHGDKNGLFILVHNKEDENLKDENKNNIKVNDITNAIKDIFSGIPIDNKYKFYKQKKKYFYFEKGVLMEKSDNLMEIEYSMLF